MQCSQLTRHSHHTIGAKMTPPPVNPNLNCILSSILSCSSGLYRETHKKVKVQQYALHCKKNDPHNNKWKCEKGLEKGNRWLAECQGKKKKKNYWIKCNKIWQKGGKQRNLVMHNHMVRENCRIWVKPSSWAHHTGLLWKPRCENVNVNETGEGSIWETLGLYEGSNCERHSCSCCDCDSCCGCVKGSGHNWGFQGRHSSHECM